MYSHNFHHSILRAYDIRGIIGTTLSADDAYGIGAGFAYLLSQQQDKQDKQDKGAITVAVGYDGRTSSPMLAEALIEGLMASGAHVITIGLGPTPMLYYADRELACDGAIQITGSHNPKDYNGFKMVRAHQSFYGEDILALGALVKGGFSLTGGGTQKQMDVQSDYINRLMQDMPADAPLMTDSHFIWDTGNGAAGPSVAHLLSQMAGTHKLLFEEVDGTFPNHHPDPVDPHTLTILRAACDEVGALCGFGFDGDGDRLGMIDAKGRIVPGDILTAYLAGELLARKPGETVLFDVKSSSTAMQLVEKAGGKAQLWKTGHSHMKSKMAEINCQLAGEMSGHIFIKDGYYGFDDALYVAVRVLQTMIYTKKTITDFMDQLPDSFTSPECRVACPDDVKFTIMDALARDAKTAFPNKQVITIDGIRVQDETGWWLVRASNTEACLVVRAEGQNEADLASNLSHLTELLAKQGIMWDRPGTA